MSTHIAIRNALQAAVDAMLPALVTGWENRDFVPPDPDVPYQEVYLKFAAPQNLEMGQTYLETGFMQVSLFYPLNGGPQAAELRAEQLRSTFYRSRSFTDSGVTVTITGTANILDGSREDDRWFVPVRIPFHAYR